MDTVKLPFYAKAALIFIAAYAFIYALFLCQQIVLPIIYALLIAILMDPLVNFLERKKVPKSVAVFLAVLLMMLAMCSLAYFIYSQVSMFADTYPELKAKTATTRSHLVQWASKYFNIKIAKINTWITETEDRCFDYSGLVVGRTLLNIGGMVVTILLLPVYLWLILFYRNHLLDFVRQLFKGTHYSAVLEVLGGSKVIIRRYLTGLLLEALVMAVLNSAGLLILGIDYAIFLGITGALVNIIPYFGGIIAIALPMTIAFVTKDSATYPLMVLGVYLIIQFIDNNFIIPYIVASKVKLNALVTIIVVLAGEMLWGIPGMFLSIPLSAILKIIFDHIESLKPWGFLMGNMVSTQSKYSFVKRKKMA